MTATGLDINGVADVSSTLTAGALSIPSQGFVFNQGFGTGVPTITMTGTANNGRGGAINFKESDGSGGSIANTAAIYSTDGAGGNATYGGLTIATYQGDMKLSTGGLASPRITILSSGNVGIGTSVPVATFDVGSANLGLPPTSGSGFTGLARIGYNDRTWTGSEMIFGIINGGGYPGYIQMKQPQDQSVERPFLLNPQGGNVSVGTTSDSVYNDASGTGIALNAGQIQIAGTGTPLYANRQGSDGDIIDFRKDGTTVGRIGIEGGDSLYVQGGGSSGGGLLYHGTAGKILPLRNSASIDATIDLGQDSRRFKDLYLSGGVYLGGTGAANKLEDYEEGTWTPAFISVNSTTPTGSFSHSGTYTKIGRLVTLIGHMQINSSSTFVVGGGLLAITGQPFSAVTGDGSYAMGSLTAHQWNPERNDRNDITIYDTTRLGFLTSNDNSSWAWEQTGSLKNTTVIRFTISYHTAA